jgi:hypothetical protein
VITQLDRYWSLAVGLCGMLAALMRVAYLMGQLLKEFRLHIRESEKSHSDYEARLRLLETVRRR